MRCVLLEACAAHLRERRCTAGDWSSRRTTLPLEDPVCSWSLTVRFNPRTLSPTVPPPSRPAMGSDVFFGLGC